MGKVLMAGIVPPLTVPSTFPPVGTPLNDMTWERIRAIADAGKANEYFKVGDTKAVHIKGTVGTLAVDTVLYVYIIGINHKGATNTIDFGTFKTANGTEIALVDSKCDSESTNGTKYFNMNHSASSSVGGWKGCDLRYDVLGSTDTKGADASETTATNPVANTLMAALPEDLRAVMLPMTVYTDNVGTATDLATNITATVDYLPLLAEYEVFGSSNYANSYEKNYLARYDYYTAGNSRVKYKHSDTSSKVSMWWCRSPRKNNTYYFCNVYEYGNGSQNSTGAAYSKGLAPIFRV